MTIGFTCIALASAGLIGSTLRAGSPAFKLFYRKPLRILGKYGYGFVRLPCDLHNRMDSVPRHDVLRITSVKSAFRHSCA